MIDFLFKLSFIERLLLLFAICYVIYNIVRFLGLFAQLLDAKIKNITIFSYNENIEKRLENSSKLFVQIDFIIRQEIDTIIQTYMLLNKKYDILNLDNDWNTISTKTYQSLDKTLYIDNATIFQKEYLFSYISNRSRLLFFQTIVNYNSPSSGAKIKEDDE